MPAVHGTKSCDLVLDAIVRRFFFVLDRPWRADLSTQGPANRVPVKKKSHYKKILHLWEFLLELLANESCRPLIEWIREEDREFKLKNPEEVARRWGRLKRRPAMNYDKLSRALRHYYSQGIIKKVSWTRSKAA